MALSRATGKCGLELRGFDLAKVRASPIALQFEDHPAGRPVQSTIRAPVRAARALNATGRSRVTLSLLQEHLRAVCGPRQEERSLTFAQKRSSQAGCAHVAADGARGLGGARGGGARARGAAAAGVPVRYVLVSQAGAQGGPE